MNINQRLKELKIDPLMKTSLTEELSIIFSRRSNIKFYISDKIKKILKDVYNPIGMWLQNPKSELEDYGVVIDGVWSSLNQSDTNYSGHSLIFNRCNKYLVNLYREKGIEEIVIDGEVFSYKNLIIFNINDTEKEILQKIDSIFKIINFKKNDIFFYEKPFCKVLMELYDKTMSLGDEAQKFYVDRIHNFFDDLVDVVSSSGRGDYNDRKEGVDVWKTHTDRKTTDQIKGTCKIIEISDGFLINSSISQNSRCDYYVFVCVNESIHIFENNIKKIKITNDGVIFPKELLYKKEIYNV